MFFNFYEFLIKAMLQLVGGVINLCLLPITLFLHYFLHYDFTPYLTDFYYYANNYIANGISYSKELFLNVTHYPRALLNLLVFVFIGKITFYTITLAIRFLINIYFIIRGHSSYSNSNRSRSS